MKPTARLRLALSACAALVLTLAACHHNDDDVAPQPPVTSPVDSSSIAIDTAHWTFFGAQTVAYSAPVPGKFEFTAEGVKGRGETNRYGCFLLTNYAYDLNNRTIKMSWKPQDGGDFCAYVFSFADTTGTIYNPIGNIRLFEDLNNLTTRNAIPNSVVIQSGVWYYTTITTSNGTYTLTTATGNYSGSGGTVVETRSGNFTRSRGRVSLRVGDPFAGVLASVVIHELSIR
ncbi:MAG: hypothetical protein EOO15_05040 [Chitinophagaceae bacterium]|nr:MAG: hypothetical protein EOO15_05040 [Chitinophagaceae bacterium]